MKDISIENFLVEQKNQQQRITSILTEFIEYKAENTDKEVDLELLNKLILDYSEKEKKLYELNLLKNKFLGMAAHDLRNPLSTISGFSDLLLMDQNQLNEEHVEFVNIIKDSSQKMLNLVNDLLDISAIESGKINLNKEKTIIIDLLKEKVRLSQFSANAKSIIIKEEYNEVPAISIDRDKIGQVIDNLITNAIKFSHREKQIIIGCYKTELGVSFSVKDEGVGIPKAEHSNLFIPFEKISSAPTAGEKSTGLGLSIIKRIIDAHNGSINIESDVDKGSSFIVNLPIG